MGIEYINEYLRRLIIENEFCRWFDIERVKTLLENYCSDYKGLLINIYEPIVINAIGLILCGGNIASLNITDSERSQLICMFLNWSNEEALEALCQASEKLCLHLKITDSAEKEYLKATGVNLYARIEAALPTNRLDAIFLSLSSSEHSEITDFQFVDGDMMEDKELRTLIDEISSCRYLSDKIAMFKQHVHSLRDSIEVLNCCFWNGDCLRLYSALDKTELALLLHFMCKKQNESPDWLSESGWEQQLIKYIKENG